MSCSVAALNTQPLRLLVPTTACVLGDRLLWPFGDKFGLVAAPLVRPAAKQGHPACLHADTPTRVVALWCTCACRSLADNLITEVPAGVFDNLEMLQIVILTKNHISKVPAALSWKLDDILAL